MLSRVQLCNPMDCSLPGFSVYGISQTRVLEWLAIPGDIPNPGTEPALSAWWILCHCTTCVYVCVRCTVVCNSLRPCGLSPPGSFVLGDSSGKNTGVGCLALLQGIFPTHGSNPGLLHHRKILYYVSHQGSPKILPWVFLCDPGSEPESPTL